MDHLFSERTNPDGKRKDDSPAAFERNLRAASLSERCRFGLSHPVQKFRDEFKSLNVMHDDSRIYLLLGIENQSETHYAMPVKNMFYDALEYAGQVENSARSHREARQWPSTSGEYLTGFYTDDRLLPFIPTAVYFGSDP